MDFATMSVLVDERHASLRRDSQRVRSARALRRRSWARHRESSPSEAR